MNVVLNTIFNVRNTFTYAVSVSIVQLGLETAICESLVKVISKDLSHLQAPLMGA